MLLRNDNQGTVTIYLVIIFAAILLFVGLFIDLARIKIAQYQTRRILNTAARSVMADYNTSLKQEYGLFSVNQAHLKEKFRKYLRANLSVSSNQNLNLLDFKYVGDQLALKNSLDKKVVLKQQILADQKYKAPIGLTSELVEKIKAFGRLTKFGPQTESGTNPNLADKLESIHENNRKINDLKKELKDKKAEIKRIDNEVEQLNQALKQGNLSSERLEQKRQELQQLNKQRANYAADMDRLNQEITSGLESSKQLIRDIEDQLPNSRQESVAPSDAPTSHQTGPSLQITPEERKYYQQQIPDQSQYEELSNYYQFEQIEEIQANTDSLDEANASKLELVLKKLKGIFRLTDLEKKILDFRDEIYINEYALNHFSNLNLPKGAPSYKYCNLEVEYLLFGGPGVAPQIIKAQAISELYLTRLALDFAVYFAYSKVPGEVVVRVIYALVRGALQATVDTYRLMNGQDVAIAELHGNNPLSEIRLTYQDHLRLFLLLQGGAEEQKLARMIQLIGERNQLKPDQAYTLLTGSVELSMKLWFLPLAGVENSSIGPFGTKISNGRCYLVKQVEFGY